MSTAIDLRIRRAALAAELQQIDIELATLDQAPPKAAAGTDGVDPGQLLSVEAAAIYLDVSQDWMYRQHEIPFVKRGTLKKFERRDLDAYKEAHKVRPTRAA